jgi:hypothetical protein
MSKNKTASPPAVDRASMAERALGGRASLFFSACRLSFSHPHYLFAVAMLSALCAAPTVAQADTRSVRLLVPVDLANFPPEVTRAEIRCSLYARHASRESGITSQAFSGRNLKRNVLVTVRWEDTPGMAPPDYYVCGFSVFAGALHFGFETSETVMQTPRGWALHYIRAAAGKPSAFQARGALALPAVETCPCGCGRNPAEGPTACDETGSAPAAKDKSAPPLLQTGTQANSSWSAPSGAPRASAPVSGRPSITVSPGSFGVRSVEPDVRTPAIVFTSTGTIDPYRPPP